MRSPLLFFCFFLFCACCSSSAQELFDHSHKKRASKNSLYIGMGFHRVFFTKSDIHFRDTKTNNYDFTLHKVKARDDNDFDLGKGLDAPQYSFRLGYYFNNKTGVEFNFDHVKYIAIQKQRVRITGQIHGTKLNQDTVLSRGFVEYEHTDGANYYMLNFLKRKPLLHSKNGKHQLNLVLKPGMGIVVPRTDSRILGWHRDDKYHISGYVIGADGGLRYEFFKYFYSEFTTKFAFANYRDVLLYGEGRARQHWFSFQTILVAGFQFPL